MDKTSILKPGRSGVVGIAVVLLLLLAASAQAVIPGITGPSFTLTAKTSHISTGDGNSLLIWGYANGTGTAQYPGPTMIVNQNDEVTVTLNNELTVPVSIVFPGHVVSATGGEPGILTREAPPGQSVTYTFIADQPGTYIYHSGTRPELQVEMGMVGALIVRPSNFGPANLTAYGDARSAYDHEYLFLLTDMDPDIHDLIEFRRMIEVDTAGYFPVQWFINGRNAPDTMLGNNVPWLPSQPYNCMPRLNPGERILLRWIGAGKDQHPFHTHGNNFDVIARDGRVLESTLGAGTNLPDLAVSDFTQTVSPGTTFDATFTWTGQDLGWDIYGHAPGDPQEPNEYGPDHGKPFPVNLPNVLDLTFGENYSGSPFLGTAGFLPPGQGGFNLNAGYFFMWHSHNEKEMTNNDIFPGGMMTMFIVEPPGVDIP